MRKLCWNRISNEIRNEIRNKIKNKRRNKIRNETSNKRKIERRNGINYLRYGVAKWKINLRQENIIAINKMVQR